MKIDQALKILEELDPPITEEWLKANAFYRTGTMDNRSRRLNNDLLLEVAPVGSHKPGEWFVWLVQDEPKRSIHVRHMETRSEIIGLIEAVTGEDWK